MLSELLHLAKSEVVGEHNDYTIGTYDLPEGEPKYRVHRSIFAASIGWAFTMDEALALVASEERKTREHIEWRSWLDGWCEHGYHRDEPCYQCESAA